MIFTKITKNDLPREVKKLVFLRFLGWKTRFPHANNAILHSFFHEVPLFRFGLILGAFWGLLGAPLGARWLAPIWTSVGPLGGFLGVLGGLLGALGSLVGPIWASVGWLCVFLEAFWCKSGHQLGDSISLGVRFGFFWVSGLRIKFFALSLDATGWVCGYWSSRFRSRLIYILHGWIFCWGYIW